MGIRKILPQTTKLTKYTNHNHLLQLNALKDFTEKILRGRTGRNSNTNNINIPAAEEGIQAHPFWHANALIDGFEIWDTRDHGFGQQDPLNQ